jgi:hypothetical protein
MNDHTLSLKSFGTKIGGEQDSEEKVFIETYQSNFIAFITLLAKTKAE